LFDERGIAQAAYDEFCARIHGRAMAFGQIVIDRDLMPGVEQFFRANRADVARTAGDKDVHAGSVEKNCARQKFKMKSRRALEGATADRNQPAILEPAFFAGDVGIDEIFVAFRQINNPFNQPDDAADAAGNNRNHYLNDALLGIAKVEFVDAKAAQQNAEDSGHDFLFGSRRFVAHSFLGVRRLTDCF
jgi:hypothetical protein